MDSYRFGAFVFDAGAGVLKRAGQVLPLQPRVVDVLRYLIERRGQLVSKDELLDHIWRGEDVNEAVISWSVSHLRRALGQQRADRLPIETVHGRGYRFTAEVSVAAPESIAFTAAPRAPALVGRGRVLAELEPCLREAAAGRGRLCVITGESGIGKTRCADELARRAEEFGLRVLSSRCPQTAGTPLLWPIDLALRPLADDETAVRVRRVIAAAAEHDERGPHDDTTRFRTLEGVAELLHELTAAHPTLLVIDDLQWADAGTLQLLAFIAPELSALPLCVVATLRDSEREVNGPRSRTLAQLLRHAHTTPLGALDAEHVGELFHAISDYHPSAELAGAVRRASGGIPLFVHEVVRSLLREHSPAELDRLPENAVRIPALARDVLRRRIDQLPAPAVELLSRAAVIGDAFDLSLLARLLELEPEALLDRLAAAIDEGLIESEAPHEYRFAHALFQTVLYDDLPPALRVAVHRKVGELLEARAGSEIRVAEIARHYYLSLAAGDHSGVMERARRAGEAAVRRFEFDDAVIYFGWALSAQVFAGAAEPRARAELLLALASAQRSAGRTGDAAETAARVIEIAQPHRMHDLVVGATRRRRATVALAMVADDLSRSALELTLSQLLDESGPVRISALAQIACVPPYDPDLARSKAWSARAVALAEQQSDREVLFEALRARLFSLSGPDDIDQVLQVAERMLALERSGERTWQSMDARVARFSALLLAGRIADADAALSEMEQSVRRPWGEATFYCARMRAQRRFLDGHFDEAEQRWAAAFAHAVRAGVSYAEILRDAQLLNSELEREGPKCVVDKRLRAQGALQRAPRALRASVARIAAQAGETDLVRAALATLGDPSDYPRDAGYLHTLASLSVCAAAIDDKARCEQLLHLLSPYAALNTPDAMGYYLGSAAHFVGLAAAALGKTVQARGHFEQALEHNRALGYRAGLVRTRLALAQVERRLGHGVLARGLLSAARDEAQALGMRGALADADAALAVK